MEIVGILWELVRLVFFGACLAVADNASQRLARCEARRRAGGVLGAITLPALVWCNLEVFLWKKCLGWGPQLTMIAAARRDDDCGCGEG